MLGLLFVDYINEIADLLGRLTGQPVFDPSIYYFHKIPTIVEPFTVAWIVLVALGIAVVASVLPALARPGCTRWRHCVTSNVLFDTASRMFRTNRSHLYIVTPWTGRSNSLTDEPIMTPSTLKADDVRPSPRLNVFGREIPVEAPPAPHEIHLECRDLHKSYAKGSIAIPVLRGVDLASATRRVPRDRRASGCGKSTLLHLLATLDRPDAGEIHFDGNRIDNLPARRRDVLRNTHFGMIFQFYHLLPELTTLENVLAPLMIADGVLSYWRRRRAHEAERGVSWRWSASAIA